MNAIALRREWFSNVRADLLSGILVALALIPEAIGFAIVAGVDPKIALYASFTIAVTIAFVGGRPGMISAATGAMAVVLVTLIRDHGIQYMFAATILTGVVQIVFSWLKLARYMRFVPRSVLVGFVCALAIVIFMAQLPQFEGANWQMYAMVAAGLVMIYTIPRVTSAIPSPLIAIIVLTAISIAFGADVRTVSDMGTLPTALPEFLIPNVPFTFQTLEIIFPYAITLAMVGLIESLLTASIIDEMTDTTSNKHREARGQGIANIVNGFLGGMAGCAMIGQSVINIRSGGRTRLSTLSAGVLLLFFILILGDLVGRIPLGALVAVMIMVSIGTFDWAALRSIRTTPKGEVIVTVATIATVMVTQDLARGVLVGVIMSALLFARRIAYLSAVHLEESEDGAVHTYRVQGQVFFASTTALIAAFDFEKKVECVVIDLTQAHLWDSTATAALDKVVLKYRRQGTVVEVIGLNKASADLLDQVGVHNKADAATKVGTH